MFPRLRREGFFGVRAFGVVKKDFAAFGGRILF